MKRKSNGRRVLKAPKSRPVLAKKIASDNRHRRRERVGEVKKVGGTVHLNREQFNARHLHCINIRMVYADIERTLTDHISYGLGVPHKVKGNDDVPSMKAHCDHPEDGMCGQNPTDEQLAWINAKLSGKLFTVGEVKDGELNGSQPESEPVKPVSVGVAPSTTGLETKPKFKFRLGGLNGS